MNVFRLFLCLAGLIVFLLVRYAGSPAGEGPETFASEPAPLEPSLKLSPLPASVTESAWRSPFQIEPPEVEYAELEDGTLVTIPGPNGSLFELTSLENRPPNRPESQVMPESQFQELHPELYQLVQNARSVPGPGAQRTMGLRLSPDGRLR